MCAIEREGERVCVCKREVREDERVCVCKKEYERGGCERESGVILNTLVAFSV